ncbi:MAG: diaminopimelate decarboxylase [Leptospiraceae bacterium]|nr:diaminopimelate decarboxylase [Leptospiraceae bacterium]
MQAMPLDELAREFGTPAYIYSGDAIEAAIDSFRRGIGNRKALICYAMKANSNLEVLRLFRARDCGMDIVSGGELYRALRAGVPAHRIVFSGVGKTEAEMVEALQAGILLFCCESEAELRTLSRIACDLGTTAPISLRVNPDVDANTHPYISTGLKDNKFGIPHNRIFDLFREMQLMPGIITKGVGFHIGSQLLDLEGFRSAARIMRNLVEELVALAPLEYIDVGGGLGINYGRENPPDAGDYAHTILSELPFEDMTIVFEPGRYMVGNAGVLLTRVLYNKVNQSKRFIICDAGMNDLIRPALYQAYHDFWPLAEMRLERLVRADLVGPVCESGDFLARDRELCDFQPGDLLAVASAGAYSSVMASNYNTRPRPPEVLLSEGRARLVRRRETYADLIHLEVPSRD